MEGSPDVAPLRFRSRVDWWLGAILVAVPALGLVAAVTLQASGDPGEATVGWIALIGIGALYIGVVWPIAYELAEDELIVRFGLCRSRVPYRSIREVHPSRSILAAPALSLDRLAIDAGQRFAAVVSPDDRDGFLDALAARAPHLERTADGLRSRSA